MPNKTISDKLKELAKDSGSAAELQSLHAEILTNIRDINQKITFRLSLMAAIAFVIELILQSHLTEIDIVGIKINNFSIIERIAPCAFSYIYFGAAMAGCARIILEETHNYMFMRAYPKSYQFDIERIVRPQHMYNTLLLVQSHISKKFKPFVFAVSLVSAAPLVIAPAAYSTWTYFRLFSKYGWNDIMLLSSVTLTILLFIQTVIVIFSGDEATTLTGSVN